MKKKTVVLNKLNLVKEIVSPLDNAQMNHVAGGATLGSNCCATLSLGRTCVPCGPAPSEGTEASVCAVCATAPGVTTC